MSCLPLKQPFEEPLVSGEKTIEPTNGIQFPDACSRKPQISKPTPKL